MQIVNVKKTEDSTLSCLAKKKPQNSVIQGHVGTPRFLGIDAHSYWMSKSGKWAQNKSTIGACTIFVFVLARNKSGELKLGSPGIKSHHTCYLIDHQVPLLVRAPELGLPNPIAKFRSLEAMQQQREQSEQPSGSWRSMQQPFVVQGFNLDQARPMLSFQT